LRFVDLDRKTSVVSGNGGRGCAFVFGERSITGVLSYRDASGHVRLGIQRFTLDGHPIDPQPMVIGDGPIATPIFAIALGSRVLIIWDSTPYATLGDKLYGVFFDPETGVATPPSLIKSDSRVINAVVPHDATSAILVFRTNGVSTQRLDITSDFHHRAAAR
jgi:hypothetical protein